MWTFTPVSTPSSLASPSPPPISYVIRGHFSSGVVWRRATVLLAEGPLVVLDDLTVLAGDAADVEAWVGGPAWQLQLLHGPAGEGAAAARAYK